MAGQHDTLEWKWDQGPIGRIVKTGYITLRREVEEQLKPMGLTHTQWSALGVLLHYPGLTSSQLEHILMIERPSVTSLMNGLAGKGLIVRRDHPGDGRSKQLFLTEEGRRLAEETRHIAGEVEERVRSGMSPEEFERLRELLVKMVGILNAR